MALADRLGLDRPAAEAVLVEVGLERAADEQRRQLERLRLLRGVDDGRHGAGNGIARPRQVRRARPCTRNYFATVLLKPMMRLRRLPLVAAPIVTCSRRGARSGAGRDGFGRHQQPHQQVREHSRGSRRRQSRSPRLRSATPSRSTTARRCSRRPASTAGPGSTTSRGTSAISAPSRATTWRRPHGAGTTPSASRASTATSARSTAARAASTWPGRSRSSRPTGRSRWRPPSARITGASGRGSVKLQVHLLHEGTVAKAG